MDELQMILMGAGVSFMVQVFKKTFPNTSPLFIVAVMSVIFGSAFAMVRHYGLLTDETLSMIKYMFASSIVIFNILKQVVEKAKANLPTDPPQFRGHE